MATKIEIMKKLDEAGIKYDPTLSFKELEKILKTASVAPSTDVNDSQTGALSGAGGTANQEAGGELLDDTDDTNQRVKVFEHNGKKYRKEFDENGKSLGAVEIKKPIV